MTDILNLDLPFLDLDEFLALGLRVKELLVTDMCPMSDETAIEVVQTIHGILMVPDTKLYVHCNAGISRSPTAVWLYLIALGIPDGEASERIASVNEHIGAPDPVLVMKLDLARIRGVFRNA